MSDWNNWLKRRRDRLMRPHGIERTFNPCKWEHGTRLLVGGELLAFVAAVVAAFIPSQRWLLASSATVGAGALFFYAFGKSSLGEMPLTGTSARRIRAVVALTGKEDKLGPIFDWDSIAGDGSSVVGDLTKMKPEIKLELGKVILRPRLEEANPDVSAEVMDQILQTLPDSEFLKQAEGFLGKSHSVPFSSESG